MKKLITSIFRLFLPLVAGAIVGQIISSSIDYSSFILPPFAPPKFVFPIAWSILYFLMGLSYFLYRKHNQSQTTIILYYTQLIVNLLWSLFFFLWNLRFFSIVWILLLDGLVIVLMKRFYSENKISSCLLIPYLIWILFATYLTIGIYFLN